MTRSEPGTVLRSACPDLFAATPSRRCRAPTIASVNPARRQAGRLPTARSVAGTAAPGPRPPRRRASPITIITQSTVTKPPNRPVYSIRSASRCTAPGRCAVSITSPRYRPRPRIQRPATANGGPAPDRYRPRRVAPAKGASHTSGVATANATANRIWRTCRRASPSPSRTHTVAPNTAAETPAPPIPHTHPTRRSPGHASTIVARIPCQAAPPSDTTSLLASTDPGRHVGIDP